MCISKLEVTEKIHFHLFATVATVNMVQNIFTQPDKKLEAPLKLAISPPLSHSMHTSLVHKFPLSYSTDT